jgi:sulfur-oxidizing protein SoxZ
MESGFRRDALGQLIAPHYITDVQISVGGHSVLEATMGPAVSQDPLLSFRFRIGRVGDPIRVAWVDNLGNERTDEGVIA